MTGGLGWLGRVGVPPGGVSLGGSSGSPTGGLSVVGATVTLGLGSVIAGGVPTAREEVGERFLYIAVFSHTHIL